MNKSHFVQTSLVMLVTLGSLLLLCGVLAYWTWSWLAPVAVAAAPLSMPQSVQLTAAPRLFGTAQQTAIAAAPTGIAIRLLGIVAATGGESGYAVVLLEPRQILAVREGAEIIAGVRLVEVADDQAILERNGIRETLAWPAR